MGKKDNMPTKSFKNQAKWKPGLRSYFEYRDLGIVRATKGKVLAHVIRANSPCTGPSGYHSHDLEFQMNYVINGWIRMEFEDEGEFVFKGGDSWYQPPNIKHEVIEYSYDLELIEITTPAEFPTKEAKRD